MNAITIRTHDFDIFTIHVTLSDRESDRLFLLFFQAQVHNVARMRC